METTTDVTTAPAGLEEESPFPLTETDKWVLSQTDEEFKLHDWEDLKITIGEHVSLYVVPYEDP